MQDLKFDGNTLLEVTSDLNKAKLSSAGIVDINQESFSANKSGIFSIRSRSSMGGSQKFFYLKSVDSIKRATESEVVPVRKSRRRSLQRSCEKQEEELILPQPQSSCPEWLASMVQQETSILLNPPLAIKIPIPLDNNDLQQLIATAIEQRNAEAEEKMREELEEETLKHAESKAKRREELKEEAVKRISPNKKKGVCSYWYSTDAINLFCPDKSSNTNVLQEVYMRILLFEEALHTHDGWLKVVEPGMTEEDTSPYEVKLFGAKIRCVKKALEEAVVRMGKGIVGDNWTSCCDEAIVFAKCIGGTEYPTNERNICR